MTNNLTTMPKITTEWQRFEELSADLLYEVLRFRQSIFVVEQSSPYLDLDGFDQVAWHLLLRAEGDLAGYLRLVPMPGPPPLIRIGRVAVASYLRRRGLGRGLMQDALRLHREQYRGHDIVLGAQTHLVSFYQGFGFATTSEPYDEFGVPHIDMMLRRSA
jgi:ElaA protein